MSNMSLHQSRKSRGVKSEAGQASAAGKSLSTGKSTPLVLVVDDDDDNLVLISYALELMGVNFVAAGSGHEVMSISRQYSFSLILLDILLPDMSGVSVLRWLRKNAGTRQVPVIAVTALAQAKDRDRILKAGFTDYLLKPYMLDDLSAMVQSCLMG